MTSNKDRRLINQIMELNKKRFIPKRREFTKEEQDLFNLMLNSLIQEEREEVLEILAETPDYNLAQ